VFFKLIKVHLLVSELYIYQNARCNHKKNCNDKNFKKSIKILKKYSIYILCNFSLSPDEGFPQKPKHVAKNINVVMTDGLYFHIDVPWLKFSLFFSVPAGKCWVSTSIRLWSFQQILTYSVVKVSLSTSELRRQCYICPAACQEYVCESGGKDPIIPNLSTW
jgi:hypothetical protein